MLYRVKNPDILLPSRSMDTIHRHLMRALIVAAMLLVVNITAVIALV